MVLTGDASGRAALLLLVFLTASLSGCLGKDKTDDGEEPGLFDWLRPPAPSPTPVQDLERLYSGDGGSCDGCIPLERPRLDPGTPTPAAPPPTATFRVPLPNLHDRVHVEGLILADDEPDGPAPFPFALDGAEYTAWLRFDAITDTDPPYLLASVTSYAGTLHTPDDIVTPYEQTLRLRLDDRRIEDIHIRGVGSLPNAFAAGPAEYQIDWRLEPGPFDLFWLGADLWGRELRDGDVFRTTWAPPGLTDYQIRYTYTVRDVTDTTADVHLRADDSAGNRASWRLTFGGGSPYPLDLRRESRFVSHHATQPLMPPAIQQQTALLSDRGTTPIAWGAPPVWPAWSYPTATADTFRPDERIASAALSDTPAYPLDEAIADLRLGSLDFRTWWDGTPERVLLEAQLRTTHTTGALTPTRELTWELTFADGHGYTSAWRVARTHAADVLAPTAHRIEDLGAADAPALLRGLAAGDLAGLKLSNGRAAAEGLAALPGDGPVDRAGYALLVVGDEIGATLRLGRTLPPAPLPLPSTGETWTGLVTEDLRAGVVTSTLVQGPF